MARALGAGVIVTAPAPPAAPAWEWEWSDALVAWSREIDALPLDDELVVCTWLDAEPTVDVVDLDPVQWRRQVEWPTALWFVTLARATVRCRDGGSVVVVADRAAALDSPGHGAEVTVAEGVVNLVRSLAAREGGRAVRVNAVISARHTEVPVRLGSPPPLATFPGRVDIEVAGAVRMLLSGDATGVTGASISSTGGRP